MKHSFSIRKRFSSVEHPFSFSLRLTLNFIGSTLLPVLLALFIIMQLISARQTQDTLTAVESHLDSLESNVRVYLNELQRVTLIPYYDENFTYYLSLANTDRQISYPEKVAIRASLENTIHLIRYTRTDLQSVLIAFNDTCLFHSSELMDVPVQGFDYAAEDWYQQAMEAKGSVVFSSPHTPAYYENANAEPVFSIVKALTNLLTRVPYAVIKVDAKATVFQETFDQVSFPVDSRLVLTDANGAIIYASRDFSPEQLNALQREGFPADGPSVLEGWASRHLSRPVSQFGWTIHAFLDQRDLNHGRYSLLSIGLLVYAACVLFMMVSYYMMSRGIVRSIAEIRGVLSRFENGDFAVRCDMRSNDELASVGQSINSMADKIEELIEQEYRAVLHRQQAELRALQSQIQPHFFFNVIGNLIALNQLGSRDRLEEALFSLSRLMRYVLDKRDTVTLEDEIAFLKDYITLQKLRFSDKLTCVFDIAPEAKGFPLPRLSLQPYIENAIIHGIEPCEHPCTVRVTAQSRDDMLSVRIADNGVGLKDGYTAGIGIANSAQRLRHYDPGSRVTLTGAENKGCTVEIELRRGKYENTDR